MSESLSEHAQNPTTAEPTLLAVPVREPWAPFDDARREAFLDALRTGVRSRRLACQILGLNRSTVNRWIKRGQATERADPEGESYRTFFVKLLGAEAARDARVDRLLHQAAPLDWRAADALGKRQDRLALRTLNVRRAKAEAEIAEAGVRAARANARRAEALAELAERGAHPLNGLLVFPSGFLAELEPDERKVVEHAMSRLGYKEAPEATVEASAAALTEEDILDRERFNARWAKLLGDVKQHSVT